MLSTSGPFSQTLQTTQSHPSAILHPVLPPSSRPQNRTTIAGTPHRVSRVASRGDLKKDEQELEEGVCMRNHSFLYFLCAFPILFSILFTICTQYIACLGLSCLNALAGSASAHLHKYAQLMCVLHAFSTLQNKKARGSV
ncbi:hypothetical protein HDV63DRAFT_109519 [Trichoderma sp. SZMC 28014]